MCILSRLVAAVAGPRARGGGGGATMCPVAAVQMKCVTLLLCFFVRQVSRRYILQHADLNSTLKARAAGAGYRRVSRGARACVQVSVHMSQTFGDPMFRWCGSLRVMSRG